MPCKITMVRRILFFFIVFASPPLVQAQTIGDKNLFTYEGKVYSVADMTGVSYRNAKTIIAKITSKYDLTKWPFPADSFLAPATGLWKSNKSPSLLELYHHQLNGVIEEFVKGRVFDLVRRRYPISKGAYYHPELLKPTIFAYAQGVQHFNELMIAVLNQSLPKDKFIERMKKAYPHMRQGDATWAWGYPRVVADEPYMRANYACFPRLINGQVPPWFRDDVVSGLIPCHVEAEIERHKDKYIQLLESQFGERSYFVILNARPMDRPRLQRLIDSISDQAGHVATSSVEKVNSILRILGSPVRLQLGRGNSSLMPRALNVKAADLVPRQFIQLKKIANGKIDYLYIFQEKPTPHFKKYSSAPGHFLYDAAYTAIITPILHEVLHSLKPAPGFELRSFNDIMYFLPGIATVPSSLRGEPLPPLLIKKQ